MPRQYSALVALAAASVVLSGCDAILGKPKTACTVSLAPGSITIPVNGASAVVGTAFDCSGNSIAKKTVTYSSSNPTFVTVTSSGAVIGKAVGSATVSGTADGKSGSVPVTVTPEVATTVAVTPASVTLRKTNVRTFSAAAKNAQGVVITGRTFTWSSSNSSIVSVDQAGQAIAVAVGTATLTAQADQAVGGAVVIVTEIPIGLCTLTLASPNVIVGAQLQPTVALKDTATPPGTLSPVGRTLTWTSSNEIVAGVSGTGVISARKAGTARITAANPENTSVSCFVDVVVADPVIATVVISPRVGTLRIGVPRTFSVQLLDASGATIPSTGRTVNWLNPTPTIASISQAGIVTGLSVGTAKIVVNVEGVADTVTLGVTKVPVGAVAVSPLQSSITQGQTKQLTVIVTDSVGAVVNDRPIDWQSSNPSLAIVSGSGLVSGLAPGSVTITATSESRSGNAAVIINQIPVDSIASDSTFTMVRNAPNASFQIRLLDATGNQLFNRPVIFTSSNPSVALGNANSQANLVTVTGLAVGETILTMRAQGATGQPEGKTTRVRVTVTPP